MSRMPFDCSHWFCNLPAQPCGRRSGNGSHGFGNERKQMPKVHCQVRLLTLCERSGPYPLYFHVGVVHSPSGWFFGGLLWLLGRLDWSSKRNSRICPKNVRPQKTIKPHERAQHTETPERE